MAELPRQGSSNFPSRPAAAAAGSAQAAAVATARAQTGKGPHHDEQHPAGRPPRPADSYTAAHFRRMFTPARRRGFAVLVHEQNVGRLARVSNVTSEPAGCVYWQTAEWLLEERLAYHPTEQGPGWSGTWLALTDLGMDIASLLDLLGIPDA